MHSVSSSHHRSIIVPNPNESRGHFYFCQACSEQFSETCVYSTFVGASPDWVSGDDERRIVQPKWGSRAKPLRIRRKLQLRSPRLRVFLKLFSFLTIFRFIEPEKRGIHDLLARLSRLDAQERCLSQEKPDWFGK